MGGVFGREEEPLRGGSEDLKKAAGSSLVLQHKAGAGEQPHPGTGQRTAADSPRDSSPWNDLTIQFNYLK